ncbi:hypothetical protein SS50377_20354 [Spironucleus salmonicida]|uniref:Uncharacterized protein n=1 Tax=Spironucleus salmonicida TaxID=348837 RepID=V6LES9_9EUKA|nr:hypothetical protein SS50377_20354 [Spironucleus salmonicida]|eukprot:EST43035.1 Hypothetical protein SS50377_17337 [Spironucleus salmonicida]
MQKCTDFFSTENPPLDGYKEHVTFLQYLPTIPIDIQLSLFSLLQKRPKTSLECRAFSQIIYLLKTTNENLLEKALKFNRRCSTADFSEISITVDLVPFRDQKSLFSAVILQLLATQKSLQVGVELYREAISEAKKTISGRTIIDQIKFNLATFQVQNQKIDDARGLLQELTTHSKQDNVQKRSVVCLKILDYQGFIAYMSRKRIKNEIHTKNQVSAVKIETNIDIQKTKVLRPEIFRQTYRPKRKIKVIAKDDKMFSLQDIATDFGFSKEQMKAILCKKPESPMKQSFINQSFSLDEMINNIFQDEHIVLKSIPNTFGFGNDEQSVVGVKNVECVYNGQVNCRSVRRNHQESFQQEITKLISSIHQ